MPPMPPTIPADRIPTIYPVPLDGHGGPVQSCRKIARAMYELDVATPLFLLRKRMDISPVETITAIPGWTVRLRQRQLQAFGRNRLERMFLHRTRAGELCVLWPGTSPELAQALKTRGNPIVLEAINTPMRHARRVLDAAYARFGSLPCHTITDQRIEKEERLYALADAIFCPSPLVEASLAETPFSGHILRTSRGVEDPERTTPNRALRMTDGKVLCLFVGSADVRKGIDRLLEIWPSLPDYMHLRIVGQIEAIITKRYAAALAHPRIEAVGHSRDVNQHYDEADIFVLPSREEGDPKVTYEAANAGLPLIVSHAGGGRLLQETSVCIEIDPEAPDILARTLIDLAANPARRLSLGRAAKTAVRNYCWSCVARRRILELNDAFPDDLPLNQGRPDPESSGWV